MTGHFAPASRDHAEALPMSSGYFSLILREHGGAERARSALLAGTGLSETSLRAPHFRLRAHGVSPGRHRRRNAP